MMAWTIGSPNDNPHPSIGSALRSALRLCCCLALVATLLLTQRAAAQPDQETDDADHGEEFVEFGGGEEVDWAAMVPVEQPQYKPGDVESIVEALGLDEDQALIARSLYDGYREAFAAAAKAKRDRSAEITRQIMTTMESDENWMSEPEGMMALQQESMDIERTWRVRRNALGADLLASVKAVLSPEQLAGWRVWERDRRRRETLHAGAQFSGEAVDLVALVGELGLDEEAQALVAPALDAYAEELDGLLVARDAAIEKIRTFDFFALADDSNGEAEVMELFGNMAERRREIRDVNRKHARALTSHLPYEAGQTFMAEFDARSYPNIYTETPAEGYFRRLLELESLTDDQRTFLVALESDYLVRVAEINGRTAALQSRIEEDIVQELKSGENPMATAMMGAMSAYADEFGENVPVPFNAQDMLVTDEQDEKKNALHRERQALAAATVEQAFAQLSLAQQEEAPRPDVPEEDEAEQTRRMIRNMMKASMEQSIEMMEEAEAEEQALEGGYADDDGP